MVLPAIHIERRTDPKRVAWYRLGAALIALAIAVALLPLFVSGGGSGLYSQLWSGTFGSAYGLQSVFILAAPLILTGLAASIPYRMGLWNIGGDGQMYIGAWLANAIAVSLPHTSGALLVPLMLVSSVVGGALWILVPALARAYLGVNEIITTLMLNFVGLYWLTYWASGPWAEPNIVGGVLSKPIPTQADLVNVGLGPVSVHWGFLLAVGLGVVMAVAVRRTRMGFELPILSRSPAAARYAGIPTRRRMVQVLLIGGAMAGLAGAVEMMGNIHQYAASISNNTGYSGIAVAILASGSELGVVAVGILFAGVLAGNTVLTTLNVSAGVSTGVFGAVLLCSAIGDGIARFHVSLGRPAAALDDPESTSEVASPERVGEPAA
jgi:simple sugar transport system permease protein